MQKLNLSTEITSLTIKSNEIAMFGTSADPPTFGPQSLLEGLLTIYPKVVTWASHNPNKKHTASLEKRSSLLNTLVKSISNPNLQLLQELSSPWAITTLNKASDKWPSSQLIFVIGSDLVEQIPKWFSAKDILSQAKIAIVPREGWPINKTKISNLQELGGIVDILPLIIPPTASSQARIKASNQQKNT